MTDKFANPWKTLSTRIVYENPWIRVREDQVLRPDGKQGIYGVVECATATGVVALSESNEVYLVGQYRYPINLYSWEIVEGAAEQGEDPRSAVARELREEAGLVATELIQLGPQFYLSNCHSSEVAVIFLARGLTQVEAQPDGTEVLQIQKVALPEALEMVHRGEISDSMSIIGLQRAARYLENPEQ